MYVTQGLHRGMQQTPDVTMTICGGRSQSFRTVAERVARLAGGLRELGVAAGDRVAMLALNSDRYHEYLLAVPWAGAVLAPLNTRWSAAELGYALRDCEARVLIVDDAHRGLLDAIRAECGQLDVVVHCGDAEAPAGTVDYEDLIAGAAAIADARRGGDALAGIFYTGGTTGAPKGAMLSHTALGTSWLGALASGDLFGAGRDTRYLHAAPMFHLADLAAWGAVTLLGGTHVIVPRFEPGELLGAVVSHRITDIALVPTMIQTVLDHPGLDAHDLSSVRSILYGASPMPQALLERAAAALPRAAFTQAYGMTELAPIATLLGPEEHRDATLRRSAGRAAPHCEIRVVDETGAEVPRGTVGEIVVRGANMMTGYWKRPAETAEAIRAGWLHTGDGGYLDEAGYLFVVDRIKDMIVTGGENVYSVEVENAVVRNPAVAQCAVIGVPDERWGERVHAVVVLRPGGATSEEQIRRHAKQFIAGYKAPRSVEFVEQLPVSAAGKVLKRELRQPYWSGCESSGSMS